MKVLRTWGFDGKLNMALDVILLENSKEPVLRFYDWARPTLSLGRHQRKIQIDYEYLKRKKFDVIVRPTGGRAVLHWDELTYSVVIPSNHELFKVSVLESYLVISECISKALKSVGYNVEIEKAKNLSNTPACFDSPSVYEIKIDGKKVVGSAQARTDKAILQHGSIVLKAHLKEYAKILSMKTEDLKDKMAGLYEYKYIEVEKLCEALEKEFEKLFGKTENFELSSKLFLEAWQRKDEFTWQVSL
ncbi:lipoate--protein ligase family protein [Pseudothermotoga thermarum]|uniref:Biotin/lipoate A/B protein ligase n=1 Tax=Pseudothermotoga thermarum DSM 5069 TaxID=688269 RepID=F7YVT4_9THEM|nr:biotin/lipoate A/B protein ligase family protein [Pseudothermotoga thermarum]AEH51755.1 biotin/lipoate A/B protein ligase [Pseudothermotoga thermarum DSM 5069]